MEVVGDYKDLTLFGPEPLFGDYGGDFLQEKRSFRCVILYDIWYNPILSIFVFSHFSSYCLPRPSLATENFLALFKFRPNHKIHRLRNLPYRIPFRKTPGKSSHPRGFPRKKKTSPPEKKHPPRWVSLMRSWWRTWPFAVLWSWSWSLPWCPIHVLPFGCLPVGGGWWLLRYSSTKGTVDTGTTYRHWCIHAYLNTYTHRCIACMHWHHATTLYVYVYLCMRSRL